MAKLHIYTPLDSVVICGEFCEWNLERSLRVYRAVWEKGRGKKAKFITVNFMPKGEYRILSCKNFACGEVYPTDGRQMPNRYFSGEANEVICVYFK